MTTGPAFAPAPATFSILLYSHPPLQLDANQSFSSPSLLE
jgi:hypothetical protein